MGIKICLLKTRETVIGELKEVIDPKENKSLGYRINHPYTIDFSYRNVLKIDKEEVQKSDDDNSEFSFRFWAPLSKDREFDFPYEFVDVIYNPHESVEKAYNTIVNHYITENTINVEVDGIDTILSYNQDLQKAIVEENVNRAKLLEESEKESNE